LRPYCLTGLFKVLNKQSRTCEVDTGCNRQLEVYLLVKRIFWAPFRRPDGVLDIVKKIKQTF